jgi:hypothetical protein
MMLDVLYQGAALRPTNVNTAHPPKDTGWRTPIPRLATLAQEIGAGPDQERRGKQGRHKMDSFIVAARNLCYGCRRPC